MNADVLCNALCDVLLVLFNLCVVLGKCES